LLLEHFECARKIFCFLPNKATSYFHCNNTGSCSSGCWYLVLCVVYQLWHKLLGWLTLYYNLFINNAHSWTWREFFPNYLNNSLFLFLCSIAGRDSSKGYAYILIVTFDLGRVPNKLLTWTHIAKYSLNEHLGVFSLGCIKKIIWPNLHFDVPS
jgi:hypothetical protein